MNQIFSTSKPSPHGRLYRYVNVKTQFIGFHAYEDAPNEVAFLKHRHRHIFHVLASIQVFHDDRELEFFLVQKQLDTEIVPFLPHNNLGSCEQMAEFILWGLVNSYGDHRYINVEVSEDDENSAEVEWFPSPVDHRTAGNREDDLSEIDLSAY